MKNALVILAGGKGTRFGQKTPKQFYKVGNYSPLNFFLSNLDTKYFNIIVLSIDKKYRNLIKNERIFQSFGKKIFYSNPGKNRQESSFNALKKLSKNNIRNVLIHDAARPFCSNHLINKILLKLKKNNNCIPYVEHNDRQITKKEKRDTKVMNIQTPQGFNYKLIMKAHKTFKNHNFSDDSSLIQKLKHKLYFLKGEVRNVKLTYPEDKFYFNIFQRSIVRSGIGYDIHQFNKKTKRGLRICGVELPFSKLIGHSDADVGIHSICDSIFGALSMRDIGYHFPNTDKKWKNVNSSKFLIFCRKKLLEKKFFIVNLDINIIAEKPKITKYVNSMKKRISELLKIDKNIISIKATTNEKIGFIGNGEGIAAESIVQITNEYNN